MQPRFSSSSSVKINP
ncbi:hypothetical protein D018_3203A, partial [Vibrio parahaemolyticus VP2007-007]